MKNRLLTPYKASLRRELLFLKKTPLLLTLGIILPVITFLFFLLFFYKGVPTEFSIALVDQDNSVLSRQLSEMIETTPEAAIIDNAPSITDAKSQIEENKIQGFVVIPDGFSKAIKSGQQPQVVFYYNNQYIISGGVLEKGISTAILSFSAGISINKTMKEGESSNQAINAVLPIKAVSTLLFNPETNYLYYLCTFLLPTMLLMFTLQVTVFTIGVELKNGTSKEWLSNADNVIAIALAGKLTPYFINFIIITLFMNMMLFDIAQVPIIGSYFLINLGAILMTFAYMSIGIFIVSILPSLRMALSITSIYAALAFSFSGITFPIIGMPLAGQYASQLFPFTHYAQIVIGEAFVGAPSHYLLFSFGALFAFTILPYITLKRLEKMTKNEKYWHKL